MSHPQKRFTKPAKSPKQLIVHLKNRGLTIANESDAKLAIERIGYYRLLIYMRPLQDANKVFLTGKSFDDVLNLYKFDRELRLLCLDAVERIEIAVRASIVNVLAVKHTAHFYTRSRHYEKSTFCHDFMASLAPKGDVMVHYFKNFNDPTYPPIWVVLETITIGTLSQLYSQLHKQNRKLVAKSFGYDEKVLVSWFRAVAALRNKCAHHNRLWNSSADQPLIAKKLKAVFSSQRPKMFYSRAVVLKALLHEIDPTSTWSQSLMDLESRYPDINFQDIGFPVGWKTDSFWI